MDHESADDIKQRIGELVKQYYLKTRTNDITPVRYAGSFHDEKELTEMVNAILDGWWQNGKRTKQFESVFNSYIGAKHSVFCNSGSSALILAFDSLNLKKGSEIVSPALTFPTTINPAVRQGMGITLVDSDIGTYNVNVDELEKAVTKETKAIILPYIMGNMSDMDRIMELVEDNNLLFLEDCCEALGSRYDGRLLGSIGSTAAFSFFPSHHISAGGGGMFTTNTEEFYLRALSFKNWGRQYSDTSYIPNQGLIRSDYVQQYTYETIGYNFNASEIEAAKGTVQMRKLQEFAKARQKNFDILVKFFKKYEDLFVLPGKIGKAQPSWFAFPLTIKQEATKKFTREELMDFLFRKKIETRYILAGNIMRHSAYSNFKFRTAGSLKNADYMFANSFFIGVYPGIDREKMKYVQESFDEFLSSKS